VAGELLKELFETLELAHEFIPGQLVRWKKGLKNRRLPKEGEPAVVVAVLADPVLNQLAEPGSAYFREPLDIILGLLDSDGDFLTFYFDKRRFEPFS
jgi:hypothetical protein